MEGTLPSGLLSPELDFVFISVLKRGELRPREAMPYPEYETMITEQRWTFDILAQTDSKWNTHRNGWTKGTVQWFCVGFQRERQNGKSK